MFDNSCQSCHSGTLPKLQGDLVSYNKKHNHVNNEESGEDNNISWNCGEENDEGLSFVLTRPVQVWNV